MKQKNITSTNFGLHALVWQEGELYVAKAIEVELASQGKNRSEAMSNLEEAISLYFEDAPKLDIKSLFLSQLSLEQISPRLYA